MNSYPPSSVGITYQFVVVAVVACGIFAAGVITVMYRRRRRAMMGQRMLADDDWGGIDTRLVLERGVFVERNVRRAPPLGPAPEMWEVELGGKGWDDGETVEGEVTWKPTALALLPNDGPNNIDVTLLLALPDPGLHYNEADPDSYDPPPYDEDVPPMVLGVCSLPVSGSGLDALRPPPPPPPPAGRVRKTRVDGFSRSLLRI